MGEGVRPQAEDLERAQEEQAAAATGKEREVAELTAALDAHKTTHAAALAAHKATLEEQEQVIADQVGPFHLPLTYAAGS